jgi:hypothetical protein
VHVTKHSCMYDEKCCRQNAQTIFKYLLLKPAPMKRFLMITAVLLIYTAIPSQIIAQINPQQFFETDSILHCKLNMDIGKYIRSKTKPAYLPATFTYNIADTIITEAIRVEARGNVRRSICNMPPMKMNFHNTTSPNLYPLGSLKLVSPCFDNTNYDQLLLKEYLIYKMYNLITEKSFRVRLLDITYTDSNSNKKPFALHAFLIEDSKALAKRNDCNALKDVKLHSENTNRQQMTLVALFEFMIGNTDFGVSVNHNTIFIQPAKDSTARPFVVPYDFDYSGLVNADYAVPAEGLDIANVRERYYLGFRRTPEELDSATSIFNACKDSIYALINNSELLIKRNKEEMINYLDSFYKLINNKHEVKTYFIDDARKP